MSNSINELQTFCEIEAFILSVLEHEQSLEQIKKTTFELMPFVETLYRKAYTFNVPILLFQNFVYALYEYCKYGIALKDVPENVWSILIQDIRRKGGYLNYDEYEYQREYSAIIKKVEHNFNKLSENFQSLSVHTLTLGYKPEFKSDVNKIEDQDNLVNFIEAVKSERYSPLNNLVCITLRMFQDIDYGYYTGVILIFNGSTDSQCGLNMLKSLWEMISNKKGDIYQQSNMVEHININCRDYNQTRNGLAQIKQRLEAFSDDKGFRVMPKSAKRSWSELIRF